jgi:hypothetical protein
MVFIMRVKACPIYHDRSMAEQHCIVSQAISGHANRTARQARNRVTLPAWARFPTGGISVMKAGAPMVTGQPSRRFTLESISRAFAFLTKTDGRCIVGSLMQTFGVDA